VFLGFTRITREPASSALFSVIVMNWFQATSAMLFARQWFFCIFLIFRSSNTIVPYWVHHPAGSLMSKNRAVGERSVHGYVQRFFVPFFRSGVPFSAFREFSLCLPQGLSRPVRKNRGFSIFSPFERVANDSKPTSTPDHSIFLWAQVLDHTRPRKQAYHFPVEERMTVQVLIVPSIGRWRMIFTSPIFERRRRSPSSLNPD